MTDANQISNSDPRHHASKIKEMLQDLATHVRSDIDKVDDPKAQALFETSAEVLLGLVKAYGDFETRSEPAWR